MEDEGRQETEEYWLRCSSTCSQKNDIPLPSFFSLSFFLLFFLFFSSPFTLAPLECVEDKSNNEGKRFCFFQWKYRVQVRTGRKESVGGGRKPRARIIRSDTYVFRSKKTNVCKIGRHFNRHECLPIRDIVICHVYSYIPYDYANVSTCTVYRRV